LWRIEQKIKKETLNAELERQRAEVRKAQEKNKPGGSSGSGIPDILGNIGGFFNSSAPPRTKDKRSGKDTSSDLRDLF